MLFYEKELKALKKVNRLREIKLFSDDLTDLASNDYLGLSHNKELLQKAYEKVNSYELHSPKASLLVNGYHDIHKEFEEYISKRTGFEKTTVVGSGFLANISLIEALVRKNDTLVLDEEFHASGILSSKLVKHTLFFKHNDSDDLKKVLNSIKSGRKIVAVEGVYSMEGDVLNKEIFDICDETGSIMIVDEAHSSGVLGENLLGVFDYFDIKPKPNHIKMATLGKAIGSYGAYISASSHIISYLTNRAKPIIYSTASSVFDIALAHEGYRYIEKNRKTLSAKRDKLIDLANSVFGTDLKSLILKIEIADNKKVLELQNFAKEQGFLIGAIREPTVKKAILRVILRVGEDESIVGEFLSNLSDKLHRNTTLPDPCHE